MNPLIDDKIELLFMKSDLSIIFRFCTSYFSDDIFLIEIPNEVYLDTKLYISKSSTTLVFKSFPLEVVSNVKSDPEDDVVFGLREYFLI